MGHRWLLLPPSFTGRNQDPPTRVKSFVTEEQGRSNSKLIQLVLFASPVHVLSLVTEFLSMFSSNNALKIPEQALAHLRALFTQLDKWDVPSPRDKREKGESLLFLPFAVYVCALLRLHEAEYQLYFISISYNIWYMISGNTVLRIKFNSIKITWSSNKPL